MTTIVHTGGFAPTVKIEPANPEAEKYGRMWSHAAYRSVSPGEAHVMNFLAQAKPPVGSTILDLGCGTGRAGLMLARMGMKVTLVDFVRNCLDENVREAVDRGELQWLKWDLTKRLPVSADYGFCCDVLEHIPPPDVQRVLANILGSARKCYLNIDCAPDAWGERLEGVVLHLSQQPPLWWLAEVKKLGGVVTWAEEGSRNVSLFVTAWKDASELIEGYKINLDIEQVEKQTQENIRAGWRHIGPWGRQEREICVLAGGPSLKGSLEEIRKLRSEGAGIVTMNGSYHWALENALEPGIQIVLDAREFNARFTKPITPYTQYLIASQCHPKTLEGLPHDRTYLWHSGVSNDSERLVQELSGSFFPIPGGSTVTLRAIALLRMIGFYRLHFFGFDSCVNGSHHAYPQPENDGEQTIAVACGGRYFQCTPWMVSQAHEFRGLVGFLGNEVEIAVHGDGLIAHMISTGAEFSKLEA